MTWEVLGRATTGRRVLLCPWSGQKGFLPAQVKIALKNFAGVP